ncbi:MAG: family 43 glycosylhydrolase [Chitinivibrionales bacterium]|nr:family 43 glycosylhydrolase [Chitinivibrionales bacterium]
MKRFTAAAAVTLMLAATFCWRCESLHAPRPTTYTNPLGDTLTGADPAVLYHEGRYYLYPTSAGDGFRCWISGDLAHWLPLGYAYRRTDSTWGKGSFWAPEVIERNGRFYMVYSAVRNHNEGYRICLAVADDPAGPFVDTLTPWFDIGWACIDGHVFVDADGTPYLFFNRVDLVDEKTGRQESKIYGVRLVDDLSSIAGEPQLCLDSYQEWEDSAQTGNWCNEGAHVFRRGGRYFMTYSVGHYAHPGYSIGYATAESPLGPWRKAEDNPLLRMDPDVGIAGPGHNSVALSPDSSELFIVYHTHREFGHVGPRVICLDRLEVAGDSLRVVGPTRDPQPLPSGSKAMLPRDLDDSLRARYERARRAEGIRDLDRQMRALTDKLPVLVYGSGDTAGCTVTLHNTSTEPVELRLSWHGSVDVAPRESSYQIKPGQTLTDTIDLHAPAKPGEPPRMAWAVVAANDTLTRGIDIIPTARSGVYASTKSAKGASALEVDSRNQVVAGQTHWHGPADCSAKAWLFRSGFDLRVAVDVTDDSLYTAQEMVHWNDGVEIYLDMRPEGERGSRRYGPGVFQLAVVPGMGERPNRIGGMIRKGAPMDSVQIRSVRTSHGYRMQITIPRAVLEYEGMEVGSTFNFDLGINDADSGPRETQLMWSGTSMNWGDARCFGRMRGEFGAPQTAAAAR